MANRSIADTLAHMQLTSPAFTNNSTIPQKYGQNFEDINPPLTITDLPAGTISLALTMDDPDVPAMAGVPVWDHWVVFNIPAIITEIPEAWTINGTKGKGTRGKLEYSGPKPPDREHRYFFRIYALDTMMNLPEGSTKDQLLAAIERHVLAQSELMGRFAP